MFSLTIISPMVNALESCVGIQVGADRDTLVNALPAVISGLIPRSSERRQDIINILLTCMKFHGGVERLLAELHQVEQGSVNEGDVITAWENLKFQIKLEDPRLNSLHDLLAAADREMLQSTYQEITPPNFPPHPNADRLWAILVLLNNIPPEALSLHPLQVFAEKIAFKLGSAPLAGQLNAWSDDIATQDGSQAALKEFRETQQLESLFSTAVTTQQDISLIVLLDPAPGNENRSPHEWKFSLRAYYWVDLENSGALEINTAPMTLEEVPGDMPSILASLFQKIGFENRERVRLEFFLPDALLSHPVDWLLTKAGRQMLELGQLHPLVVRSLDRTKSMNLVENFEVKAAWASKWKAYKQYCQQYVVPLPGVSSPGVSSPGVSSPGVKPPVKLYKPETFDPQNLQLELLANNAPVGLGLTFMPLPVGPEYLLYQILDAGTPIALWPRPCDDCDNYAEDTEQVVKELIENTLPQKGLPALPRLLHSLRSKASQSSPVARYFTLLWDDYERQPAELGSSTQTRLSGA